MKSASSLEEEAQTIVVVAVYNQHCLFLIRSLSLAFLAAAFLTS
jgi:hypothetical protein